MTARPPGVQRLLPVSISNKYFIRRPAIDTDQIMVLRSFWPEVVKRRERDAGGVNRVAQLFDMKPRETVFPGKQLFFQAMPPLFENRI